MGGSANQKNETVTNRIVKLVGSEEDAASLMDGIRDKAPYSDAQSVSPLVRLLTSKANLQKM